MMTRYIITESGLAELDKYFIENKDSLIKIAWKNLKDKEIRPYDSQVERDRVLDEILTEMADIDAWGEKKGGYLIIDDDIKAIIQRKKKELRTGKGGADD